MPLDRIRVVKVHAAEEYRADRKGVREIVRQWASEMCERPLALQWEIDGSAAGTRGPVRGREKR